MTAQVTIWDVLSAYVSEDGNPGEFKVGERFMVSRHHDAAGDSAECENR